MWPFDDIGSQLGGKLQELVSSAFESVMRAVWDASLWILRVAFKLADQFSVFTVDTGTGPVGVLWPMMLWTSGVVALGLFFWQLTMTSLRGGSGFMRLVGGPIQYGIALAVTAGCVGSFLVAADGLTNGILERGLQSSNFSDALQYTTFADAAQDEVKAVVLGLCALIGVLPAGIGYVLEMLFREAAVYVLVATIPIAAAGLLANVTKSWFWKTVRWILACIAMKPVLALALVLGVAISGGSKGLSGLLAGVGVLIISLFVPFVLFRLFAFVDPNSDAGSAFRDALSSAGVDSYGAGNPAMQAANAATGGSSGGGDAGNGGGSDAQESANTGRFDEATADYADDEMDSHDIGQSSGGGSSSGAQSAQSSSDSAEVGDDGGDGDDTDAAPGASSDQASADGSAPHGPDEDSGGTNNSSGDDGNDPPPSEPPDPSGGHDPDDGGGGGPRGGGGGGPQNGGGGGAAEGGEAAEAAVIV